MSRYKQSQGLFGFLPCHAFGIGQRQFVFVGCLIDVAGDFADAEANLSQ